MDSKKKTSVGKPGKELNENPATNDPIKNPLTEGEHYYWEGDLFVFTAKFLAARGYCCKSGCRHCPYGYIKPLSD